MLQFFSNLFGEDEQGTIILLSALLVALICIVVASVMSGKVAKNAKKAREAGQAFEQLALAVAQLCDSKDKFVNGHSKRVANISVAIGKELKYPDLDKLYFTALLHDIGNIAIPDNILLRSGRLTPDEFAIMMNHTDIGAEFLDSVKAVPKLSYGAKYHHEHVDGSGYNYCLDGSHTPLEGKIVGVAEAYDAMTSDRSYRMGLSANAAVEELKRCSGTQFDKEVANALVSAIKNGFTPDKDVRK